MCGQFAAETVQGEVFLASDLDGVFVGVVPDVPVLCCLEFLLDQALEGCEDSIPGNKYCSCRM